MADSQYNGETRVQVLLEFLQVRTRCHLRSFSTCTMYIVHTKVVRFMLHWLPIQNLRTGYKALFMMLGKSVPRANISIVPIIGAVKNVLICGHSCILRYGEMKTELILASLSP